MVSSPVVNSSANTYTVVQQGSQQILVPASSLKSIQGLKVIPLSQHNVKGNTLLTILSNTCMFIIFIIKNIVIWYMLFLSEFVFNFVYVIGRSQMFARIVNPDSVRPVFIQQQSSQDTSQGPSESNT